MERSTRVLVASSDLYQGDVWQPFPLSSPATAHLNCLSWLGASSLACGASIIIIVDMFVDGQTVGNLQVLRDTRDVADDIS